MKNLAQDSTRPLLDRFRCTDDLPGFELNGQLSHDSGYFRFGPNITCYGQCSSGLPAKRLTDPLHDARGHVSIDGPAVQLPFDFAQVVDNLRYERYLINSLEEYRAINVLRSMYYFVRPFMPPSVRRSLQKLYFRDWDKAPFPTWPVDHTIENILEQLLVLSMKSRNIQRIPFIWFWPNGASSCTMVTHDVETRAGMDFCGQVMDLNDSFAIKTSFQLVPEKRYAIPWQLLDCIRKRGFEINIHDLNHDGRLFRNRKEFLHRAERINDYGRQFGALGFRSAVMYRNVEWYDALDFSYDMSIPNVAHLDPQRGGCCSVFPFFVGKILELPVTTTQDYTLFHIFNDYSIRLWREQVSLIKRRHGLISFIIHPDYIIDGAARSVYTELLQYLSEMRSHGDTWIALPREVAAWWRLRSELNLVKTEGAWRIDGEGKERAVIAYAEVVDDRLTYGFAPRF